MNNTPQKVKKKILADDYYRSCARADEEECDGRITWEHALMYAGKQVQEVWAIIPLCWFHHLGAGLDKRKNIRIALSRATPEELKRYERNTWRSQI